MSKAKGGGIKKVDLGWDDPGTSLQGLLERSISDNPNGKIEPVPNELPLDVIDHNPYQARQAFNPGSLQELADSIREHGIIEPIIVRPVGDAGDGGPGGLGGDRYEIVAGERRYRAALLAELTMIPARVMELDDTQAAIVTTLENLQREDLDIEDEARQFAYVLEKTGMSQRALARKLGIDHRYVMRRVKLLERPDLLQAYRDGRIKLHDAVAMADMPSDEIGSIGALRSGSDGETGPLGTSAGSIGADVAGEGWLPDGDDLDLVERDDMPGFIVARSSQQAQTGPRGTSSGQGAGVGSTGLRSRFRWRPVQQFYTWVGRTHVTDVPPAERTTLKVQLTEIKEALEKQIAELEQLEDASPVLSNAGEAATAEPATGETGEPSMEG